MSGRLGSGSITVVAGLVLAIFAPAAVADHSDAESSPDGPTVSFTAPPPGGQHHSTRDTDARFEFAASEPGATFECRLDHDDFQPCASPALYPLLAEGVRRFEVRATGPDGKLGEPLAHTWAIDRYSPETSLWKAPYGGPYLAKDSAEFQISVRDGWRYGLVAECRLDDGEWRGCPHATVWEGPWVTYNDLSDGEHTFAARGRDAAGNVEAPGVTSKFWIDTKPPAIRIHGPPARTESRDVSFYLESEKDVTGYECRLDDGDWTSCHWLHEVHGLSEGDHVLAARATDRARNRGEPVEHRWRVDDLPRTTITRKPPERAGTGEADFEFVGTEPATFECRVVSSPFVADEPEWTPCSSPHDVAGLADRRHSFQVRATDETGGTGPVAGHTWWVDTTPPEIYLSAYPSSRTNSRRAEFVFSASDNPVSFRCQVDGRDWTDCSSPFVVEDLPEGEHSFRVRAGDETGNEARERSWSWSIDTQPPITTITEGPDRTSDTTYASFGFTASEPEARFRCRFDEGEWRECWSSPYADEYSEGDHLFEVFAIDRADNEGPVARHPWTVDTGTSTDSPQDVDGDGKSEGDDNCPADPNAGQADGDGDGRGDVCDPDDDGDGLTDSREDEFGSVRLDRDSDDDGIADGVEVRTARTHPARRDSDRDDLTDGLERGVARGVSDPPGQVRGTNVRRFRRDVDPATKTDARRRDADRDGRTDGEEDSDRDGRRDRGETDPRRSDSDGDGFRDGQDRRPLDPRRH